MTPYLACAGAAEAIDFYVSVFGFAERGGRFTTPDGVIGHAELVLGDPEAGGAVVMLSDPWPDHGVHDAESLGGSPVSLTIYVEDCDSTIAAAVAAGATVTRPAADQFHGDRIGHVRDPWGHRWAVATHIETVSDEEMARRAAEHDT